MSGAMQEPITHQPVHKEAPSYQVVTGSEEWHHEMFGCLDGGISANDHLCMNQHQPLRLKN